MHPRLFRTVEMIGLPLPAIHARGTAAGQRVELQVIHLEAHNLDQVEDTDGVIHDANGKMPSTVDDIQEVAKRRRNINYSYMIGYLS
jgi:hypothetical protein